MRRLVLVVPLLATTLLTACSGETPAPAPAPGPTGEATDSIINGQDDTTRQAVVFVSMGNAACTGTIIAKSTTNAYVLTAGHCVTPNTPELVIQGNDYTTGSNPTYPAVQSEHHPGYSGQGSMYDVGMIRVTGAGSATPVIAPATSTNDGLNVGSVVTHVGYGITAYPDTSTTHRHYTTNTIATLQASEFSYHQPTSGPCSGDSGGPALSQTDPELVVGVVSRGDGECNVEGISERVSAMYASFILPFIEGTPIGPLTCDECTSATTSGQGACMGAVNACLNNTECSALVDCLNACTTYSCQQGCLTQHQAGYALYDAIFTCVCQSGCATECASDSMCQGGTGGSGTGGSGTGGSGTGGSGTGGSGTGNTGTGGGAAAVPGDSWVAGDTPEQDYHGEYLSSCAVGRRAKGTGAAWMALWATAAGLAVAARRRRR
jgi:hypothetical protein